MCFLLLFSQASLAGKWEFQPKLSLTETYYDNIGLASENKNKELVTQVMPGFSFSKKSRRIQLSSDYSFGYIKYLGNEFSDSSYNRASAAMSVEAIRRHFFINADASISQQVVDPSQAYSSDVALVNNNQTEARTFSLQPRLANRFGRYANSDLSYKRTFTNYSSEAVGSSRMSALQYNLSSGRWFKQLSWYANATHITSNQENAENSSAQLRVDYNLSQHWTLFALGRAQKNNYLTSNISQTQDAVSRYYINPEAGVVWTASRKLKIEAGGGATLNAGDLSDKKLTVEQPTWRASVNIAPSKRTTIFFGRESSVFGDRKFFNLSLGTRHTNWTSGYAETLITPQQLRISSALSASSGSSSGLPSSPTSSSPFSPAPSGGGITGVGFASGGELGRAVTNDVILRKRLDFSGTINRRKATLTGGAFHDIGEYQTSDISDKRYGMNGGVDFNMGRSMNWSNKASAQRYYFDSRVDNIYTVNSSLSRKIKKHVSTSLEYQWQKRNTLVANAQYTAQQVSAKLNVAF